MKLKYSWSLLPVFGLFLLSKAAHADLPTHLAKIEIELSEIDEKGKMKSLESKGGQLSFDITNNKCSINIRKNVFPCAYDSSEDILNSKGELVMKSLPQIKIDTFVIDTMLIDLLISDGYKISDLSRLLVDVSSKRPRLFKLPFYDCIDCENNGKDLRLFNAYYGSVERGFTIEHPYLGKKKLVFGMKVKKIEPQKGAFYIIGNDNAAQYGQ